MINLDRALTEKNFKSRMLLQVHDEIVLEVPNGELTAVRQLVKETMEAAIELAVPLVLMKMPAKLGTRRSKIRYKERQNRLKIRNPDEGSMP